jgi:hypothetical protein
MAGFLAETPEEVIRYSSILRAVGSAGGAIACEFLPSLLVLILPKPIGGKRNANCVSS